MQTARDRAHAQAEHLNIHLTQELQARDHRYDEAVQSLQAQLERTRETVVVREDTLRQNAQELGSLQQALKNAQSVVVEHEKTAETLHTKLATGREQHQALITQRAALEQTVADQAAECFRYAHHL